MRYLLFFLFLSQVAFSQEINTEKLDRYFQTLEQHDKFMGSVALSRNGKIIYTHSSGYADVSEKIANTQKTTYHIGSVSKTFTAVLILKAIAQNKLDLHETLDHFFPEIENAPEITIEQLLRHQSGIHNFTSNPGYRKSRTEAKSRKEMLKIIRKGGSDFPPGSQFQYSNSNYVLLSYILEDIFNNSYAKILQNHIVEPLGLQHTYYGDTINVHHNESRSYKYVGKWKVQPETHASIPLGGGGIVSTPTDLLIFAEALFNGKLAKPKLFEKMTQLKHNYGFGLLGFPFYGHKAFGHTGGIDGFRAIFSYFPKEKIGVAITVNALNYSLNKISIALLSEVFGKTYKIPEFKSYKIQPGSLEKYVGNYTSGDRKSVV